MQRGGLAVDWRFISLPMINAAVDYDSHFPAGYEAGHTAGLRLLRVAARTRAEHGRGAVRPLYAAIGARIFDTAADSGRADGDQRGTRASVEPILSQAGRPAGLADALEASSYDAEIRGETDEALALTGKDIGTPIIQFQPPSGVAFFGPVISRLPTEGPGRPVVGPRAGPGQFPGLRRARAQPARTAAATQLRRRARPGPHPGSVVRRQPACSAVALCARALPALPCPRAREPRARPSSSQPATVARLSAP